MTPKPVSWPCPDPFWLAICIAIALAILIVYYIFLAKTILQMLRRDANTVMLVFAFLALTPIPPSVIAGIVIMIIWHLHKKTLPET